MNHRRTGWNIIPRSRAEWDPRGMALSAREEWARDTEASKNWSFLQLSQFGFLTHHPKAFSLRLNNMGGVATLLNFLTFLLKDSWPRWCSVTFYNSSGVKIRAAIGAPPEAGKGEVVKTLWLVLWLMPLPISCPFHNWSRLLSGSTICMLDSVGRWGGPGRGKTNSSHILYSSG